jgi:hypothetical protein
MIKTVRKKPFKFSYKDLAIATGYSVGTLRNKVAKGEFNPRSLESLCLFIASCALLKNAKATK